MILEDYGATNFSKLSDYKRKRIGDKLRKVEKGIFDTLFAQGLKYGDASSRGEWVRVPKSKGGIDTITDAIKLVLTENKIKYNMDEERVINEKASIITDMNDAKFGAPKEEKEKVDDSKSTTKKEIITRSRTQQMNESNTITTRSRAKKK